MQGEYLGDGAPIWIDYGPHLTGLEFCARKAARLFGSLPAADNATGNDDGRSDYPAFEMDDRTLAVYALREVADGLPGLSVDGVGAAEANGCNGSRNASRPRAGSNIHVGSVAVFDQIAVEHRGELPDDRFGEVLPDVLP